MLNSEIIWINNFKAKVKPTLVGKHLQLTTFVDEEVTGKLLLSQINDESVNFTFSKSTFLQLLDNIIPSLDKKSNCRQIAAAWNSSISISKMTVLPGAYILPLGNQPASVFSIANIMIQPISLVNATTTLENDLLNINNNNAPIDFVKSIRKAFLSLEYKIDGTNSITPTPTPLTIISGTK